MFDAMFHFHNKMPLKIMHVEYVAIFKSLQYRFLAAEKSKDQNQQISVELC